MKDKDAKAELIKSLRDENDVLKKKHSEPGLTYSELANYLQDFAKRNEESKKSPKGEVPVYYCNLHPICVDYYYNQKNTPKFWRNSSCN